VRHWMIDILRCRRQPYSPFPKEHERDQMASLARRMTQA
jgi:hypothetical protein